jgi:RHS repeat-associated protein
MPPIAVPLVRSFVALALALSGLAATWPARRAESPRRLADHTSVTPDGGEASAPANASGQQLLFTVTNTSGSWEAYTLTCGVGGQVTSCSSSPDWTEVGPNSSVDVTVTFSTGAAGDGTLSLTALSDYLLPGGGTEQDAGDYVVTVTPGGVPGAPVVATRNFNGDNQERSLCLTMGAGQAAGLACGDLFVVHGMPGYRTMGRDRSLTLFYSSHQAAPRPLVAASVTIGSGVLQPNSVYAELQVSGAVRASATYAPWSDGSRQVALAFDASGWASGLYPFTLVVRNVYSSGSYDATVSGTLIVVNRSASEFGAGWWLAGVEQLVLSQPANQILWLGGDGSAAVYSQVNATTWVRARGAYRDTLVLAGGIYTRYLRHGVKVRFDGTGRHIQTEDRVGNITTFNWTGATPRLTSIQVPPGGSATTYTLAYESGSGVLDYMADPVGRVLNATVTSGNLVSLLDPDNVFTNFEYDPARRLTRRVNRRGYGTLYSYANALRVTKVRVPLNTSTGDTATTDFSWWDERGLAIGVTSGTFSPADLMNDYTKVFGPRPNVADDARFRVDRWGAPVLAYDALNNLTTVTRADTANPALPTRVQFADGRILGAGYNARGNLVWMADSTFEGTRTGTQTVVTSFLYGDANHPDSPTEIRSPVDTTRYRYNGSLGLLDSVISQGGARTIFTYYTANPWLGLLQSVTSRGVRVVNTSTWTRFTQDLTTSFAYDALGNDTATTLPSGSRTRRQRDSWTRVLRTLDEANHVTEYTYDALNRVTAQAVLAGSQWNIANYFYSLTSQVDSIKDSRWVKRAWGYDAADRAVTMTDEAGAVEQRYVNRDGLTDSVRTRSNLMLRFRYDAAGLLRVTTYPQVAHSFSVSGHEATIAGDSVVRVYDAVGRVVSIRRSDDTITNTWNREGSLRTQRQLVWSGGVVKSDLTVDYWTDAGGRRTRYAYGTHAGPDTIRYDYGADGQLALLVARWAGAGLVPDTFRFYWDVLGRRDSLIYLQPGVHVTNGYDIDGRLRMVCSRHPSNSSGADYLEHSLLFTNVTADGLAQDWWQTVPPGNLSGTSCGPPFSNVVEYGAGLRYDGAHQLTRDNQHDISYDRSGNRMARRWRSDGTLRDSLAYPLYQNRLMSQYTDVLARKFNYTADGSMHEELPQLTADGTRLFYYNALREMTGIKTYVWTGSAYQWLGGATWCEYDPLGRRVHACESSSAWFGFDGDNVIRNHGAWTLWRYVHGPGLDDPLVGLYATTSSQFSKYYYLTDGSGRHLTFTAADGTKGELVDLTFSQNGGSHAGSITASRTFENSRGESPQVPSLSFYRNRYYDQQTGRWTQEDPIGIAGGVNLYGYVGNNPVAYTDPFGLKPCRLNTALGEAFVEERLAQAFFNAVGEAVGEGYAGDLNQSFRTLEEQQAQVDQPGSSAAPVGSSGHEAGTAADLDWRTVPASQRVALQRALNRYGFVHTYWKLSHFEHRITAENRDERRRLIGEAREAVRAAGGKRNLPACNMVPPTGI